MPKPIEVETARAERGPLAETVSGDRRTRVKQLHVVATPVDGELERIAVQAGDPIDTATPLARIWPVAIRVRAPTRSLPRTRPARR